jgi:hypothetical protein
MRLLNSRTRCLEVFAEAVPLYAILSHTWEEEEVCFRDFNDPNIDHVSMKGWYKIRMSCEQALHDGLDYVWIDTVCIDRGSSAELSEAINSMFWWYRNSTLCYTYLSDLPAVEMKASRWFTRGWTLQEMIAPKHVNFFDRNWKFNGAKSELVRQLHEITGVDKSILLGGNLRLISVARKMSWAAQRQTTRVEDMAYCLLGLFDISMPMLYGEGHKAFRRLQEEIVKEYDDHSLFAWRAIAPSKCTGLFAKSPAEFAGSANIVPCLGRRSEPTIVTSRGVRISACLTKSQDGSLDKSLVLGVINCRFLDFDMESTKRIAIALRVCYDNHDSGAISGYVRLRPGHLFATKSIREERQSLYVLKDNYLGNLTDTCILYVRTMPLWVREKPFEFVHAYPQEQWDEENSLFRVKRLQRGVDQFALVFRQVSPNPDGEAPGCFVVFLMLFSSISEPIEVGGSSMLHRSVNPMCYIQFHQSCDVAQLKLNQSWEKEASAYNVSAYGAGMVLKCYTSRAIVSGQEIYYADLHTKEMDEYIPLAIRK